MNLRMYTHVLIAMYAVIIGNSAYSCKKGQTVFATLPCKMQGKKENNYANNQIF